MNAKPAPGKPLFEAAAANFNLSWEVDLFGRVASTVDAAKADTQQSEALFRSVQLALQADGMAVTTIEGLADADGTLHPMQEMFREHHALQCGFCTPGMVMTAIDLVQAHPDGLTEKEIREGLEGNLCRCTGYHNIVKAIAAAHPLMHAR